MLLHIRTDFQAGQNVKLISRIDIYEHITITGSTPGTPSTPAP